MAEEKIEHFPDDLDMTAPGDIVTVGHPDVENTVVTTRSRLENLMAKKGWVEVGPGDVEPEEIPESNPRNVTVSEGKKAPAKKSTTKKTTGK